jgi:ABC-2 type transport system ATP-binding protein
VRPLAPSLDTVGPMAADVAGLIAGMRLLEPGFGVVPVLGRAPGQSAEFLDSVGYLAQDVPLYKRLSVGDHLAAGAAAATTSPRR